MEKFLNQVIPKKNESLYSFLFRTATANYHNHLGVLIKEMGPTTYCINCNYLDKDKTWYKHIVRLIQMTHTDPYLLTLNQYDRLFIQNEEIGKQQERFLYYRSTSKYCPECLKEDRFHRLFWDVSMVSICLKHQKYLMEDCPVCNKKSRTSRIMQDRCTCNHRFSEYVNSIILPSPLEIRAQKCIQSLLLGDQSTITIPNDHSLSKEQYFQFFILFGHIVDNLKIEELFPLTYGQTVFNYGMKNKIKKDILSFSILATFLHFVITNPKQYLLPVLQRLNDESQVTKYIKKYKMKFFYKIISVDAGKPYEEIYKQFLINSDDVYVNRKIINIPVEDKQYLTFDEVINRYKIPLRRLTFLCKEGTIKQVNENGSRLIEKESVEKYVQIMSSSLNQHQVGKVMGLNSERVIDLALLGKLKAYHGPKIDGNYFWSFQKLDVEQTLNWIRSKCQLVNNIKKGYISFNKANFAVRHIEINTVALIEMVASGELPAIILKDEPNIRGIYILEKALTDLCQTEKDKRIKKLGYTLLETSHILNIDVRKLKKWVQEGRLQTNHEKVNPNGTISYYIKKRIVERMSELQN